MKLSKLDIVILAVPLLAAAVSMFFLPDIIPLHWNSLGEVDGSGSKYILLPVALIPFVVYRRLKAKYGW